MACRGLLPLSLSPFICLQVFAKVTVTPVLPYTLIKSSVHYANFPTDTKNLVIDTGFKNFDFTKTQFAADVGTVADANFENMLFFDVTTDKEFKEEKSKRLVLMVVPKTSTGETKAGPIAYAGNKNCILSDTCQGKLDLIPSGTTSTFTYARAARYTSGSTLRVGIYPGDICLVSKSEGNLVAGCNDTKVASPTAGTTQITVNFIFSMADDADQAGPIDSNQEKSEALNLVFTAGKATYSCDRTKMDSVYFPGDGELQLETEHMTATNGSSNAPVNAIMVVGQDGGKPVTDSSLMTANSVVTRVPFNEGTQSAKGFTNTTTGDDHTYGVALIARDASGVVSEFSDSCELKNVQTTAVQGFLSESQCFVASAAYRTQRGPVVMLLREFRDSFLLQHNWGRVFVRHYYITGPKVAAWVSQYSVLRIPALRCLMPLQLVAWLTLNPGVLLVWALGALGIVAVLVNRERSSQ